MARSAQMVLSSHMQEWNLFLVTKDTKNIFKSSLMSEDDKRLTKAVPTGNPPNRR